MVAIELIDWTEDVVFDLDRGRERKGGGKAVDRLFSCEVDMIWEKGRMTSRGCQLHRPPSVCI